LTTRDEFRLQLLAFERHPNGCHDLVRPKQRNINNIFKIKKEEAVMFLNPIIISIIIIFQSGFHIFFYLKPHPLTWLISVLFSPCLAVYIV
jgi:hypothetical protein